MDDSQNNSGNNGNSGNSSTGGNSGNNGNRVNGSDKTNAPPAGWGLYAQEGMVIPGIPGGAGRPEMRNLKGYSNALAEAGERIARMEDAQAEMNRKLDEIMALTRAINEWLVNTNEWLDNSNDA